MSKLGDLAPPLAPRVVRAWSLLLLGLAMLGPARAGGIVDPTLPPPGYGPGASAEGKDAPVGEAAASPDSNRLQMILLRGAQRTAILGNRSLKVGDNFDFNGSPARVLSIGADRLVLQQGNDRVTLNLVDDVAAVRRVDLCPAPTGGRARCRKP